MHAAAPLSVHRIRNVSLAIAALGLTACASFPKPNEVMVPAPIQANTGKFLSPYTSDGTIAPWVRNARAAAAGAAIGGFVGRKAGEQALAGVPFIGGILGKKVGSAAGRAAALALVGGEDAMKRGSDLSFQSADELAVFLYAYQPADANEQKEKAKVISLTQDLYPDVADKWEGAIKKARLRNGQVQVMPIGMPGAKQ